MSKIALAYSGGLDSAVILHWLASRGHDVVAFTAQLGGHEPEFEYQALDNGAQKAFVEDLREHWITSIATAARQMDAVYGKYLLHVALSKVAVAEYMARMAHKEGMEVLAHGAHSGENDYYRLHNGFTHMSDVLGAEFTVYAPWEDDVFKKELPDREALLNYVKTHNMQFCNVGSTTLTSEPTALGVNYENGDLVRFEETSAIPGLTAPVTASPEEIRLHFSGGDLTKLDTSQGSFEDLTDIVEVLHALANQRGIGLIDVIEPNIDGSKARCVYVQPATSLWHEAHIEMGNMVLDNDEIKQRDRISHRSGELIYHGHWFSDELLQLREIAHEYNQRYNGWVRYSLHPGYARIVGRGLA